MRTLVNGVEGAAVNALDRGLQYGDGLFETMAIRNGRPRLLEWHLDRLEAGCARLGLTPPPRGVVAGEVQQVAAGEDCVIKLVLTRGSSGRGYRPDAGAAQTRIVAGFTWPEHPVEAWVLGVRVRSCSAQLGGNPGLAGIKHLNRLEQVMARREWDGAGVAEGLMQDQQGNVVCGTHCNLFVFREGCWMTPPLDRCGVAGVMRRALLQWAAGQGMAIEERRLPAAELILATEMLLTNALIGAWPVREVDGRMLAVGPLAARFNAWLEGA